MAKEKSEEINAEQDTENEPSDEVEEEEET